MQNTEYVYNGVPWVNAYVGSHEFASDTYPTKSLDLCAVVLPNNIAFHRREWIIKNEDEDRDIPSLKGTIGDIISVGCQIQNHTECMTVLSIIVGYAEGKQGHSPDNTHTCPFGHECWYNLTMSCSILKMCLWADSKFHSNLSLQFKTAIKQPSSPTLPPIKSSPYIYNTSPFLIKNLGQQQVFFNPRWCLKSVELAIHMNVSAIRSDCSAFLGVAYTGWLAWLYG